MYIVNTNIMALLPHAATQCDTDNLWPMIVAVLVMVVIHAIERYYTGQAADARERADRRPREPRPTA